MMVVMEKVQKLPAWCAFILLGYMPFHVFISQSFSLVTGGLDIWKLAKEVAIILTALLCITLVLTKKLSTHWYRIGLLITGLYGVLHLILYLTMQKTNLQVALLATIYNLRPLLFLLIGLSIVILWQKKFDLRKVINFALIISTIVAVLGIVQYFLPTDFLTQFGYSDVRGAKPSFLIDNKPDLPRVMSTLREPNSLGAFLVFPIMILLHRLLSVRPRKLIIAGVSLHVLALLLTFSRSAVLALIISLGVYFALAHHSKTLNFVKKSRWVIIGFVLLIGFGTFMLRDQYFVQNVLFHSDENTMSELDSNEKHFVQTANGVDAVMEAPIGYGPGTAGPVSMHSEDPFITENYYLQLAHEIGIVGLMIFLLVCVLLCIALIRIGSPEAQILLAVFAGYAVCNIFLHTWANEAVVAQWWLLCGLIIGRLPEFSDKAAQR